MSDPERTCSINLHAGVGHHRGMSEGDGSDQLIHTLGEDALSKKARGQRAWGFSLSVVDRGVCWEVQKGKKYTLRVSWLRRKKFVWLCGSHREGARSSLRRFARRTEGVPFLGFS
ncbi:hypothetical protein KP509_30G060800 [Ceratopteris richardii]|uniref:Uncharacterized protein n=1 Tax=Ceratopteris richardii TaxID=49495 RepID=A0A8T2R4N7_CERRI|nr:hypothetical protein KP509_30G060800 [Ceratopteris richardii]